MIYLCFYDFDIKAQGMKTFATVRPVSSDCMYSIDATLYHFWSCDNIHSVKRNHGLFFFGCLVCFGFFNLAFLFRCKDLKAMPVSHQRCVKDKKSPVSAWRLLRGIEITIAIFFYRIYTFLMFWRGSGVVCWIWTTSHPLVLDHNTFNAYQNNLCSLSNMNSN